jgi:hypothetical protein
MCLVRDRNSTQQGHRRRSLLVGMSRQARLRDAQHDQRFDSMVELRLQNVRLEQIRIRAAQRDADREVERERIEERRRLREDRDRAKLMAQEDEAAQQELDAKLSKVRERLQRQIEQDRVRAEEEKAKAASEAVLADKVARLMRGEWSPDEE